MLNPYIMYVKIAVVVSLLGIIGTLYFMVDHYKGLNKQLTMQVENLTKTNEVNAQTISMMKKNADRALKLCTTRLEDKDKTIAKLEEIYNLTEGSITNEGDVIFSGNGILDSLNSVFPKSGYAGGVCKAGDTSPTGKGEGQAGDILRYRYCFNTKQDILNLLRNQVLHEARERDMENILQSFQTGTK